MKATWLIERNVYREHATAFKAEVERQGMDCLEVDYRPGKSPPADILGAESLASNACAVLWGSMPLMRQIQLRREWSPGGWCNSDHLACSTYYIDFARYLLNRDYKILPGEEALRLQDQLYDEFGVDDEIFVRPDGVQKIFPGGAVFRDNFRDAISPSRYDPSTLIVVSTPKFLGREWRLVIAGDEIVAASQYRDQGAIQFEAGCPADVEIFVAKLLRDVRRRPDPVFVMDVCESDGGLHLLELNSFSCSGLYACDLAAVIRAASAVAESAWKSN